jgi:hypothetical protein
MSALELLGKTANKLARRLDAASEPQLQRVAAAIAQAAVERTGLAEPAISEALEHLQGSRPPQPALQKRVADLTEQLDEEYFRLKELEDDDDDGPEPRVLATFSKARAAAAVAAALGAVARTAAAEAAYEAIAATDDLAYLTAVADKILSNK